MKDDARVIDAGMAVHSYTLPAAADCDARVKAGLAHVAVPTALGVAGSGSENHQKRGGQNPMTANERIYFYLFVLVAQVEGGWREKALIRS